MFQAGEEHPMRSAEGDDFLAVSSRHVARPELEIFYTVLLLSSEEDDRVSMLGRPDPIVPEDLQEISRKGSREIREVRSESEFVEEACCSGAVGIPASPDTCAIRLS